MSSIEVENLFKVFGPPRNYERAMEMARNGEPRPKVQKETGCTVAVRDATFTVEGKEIFVIMGLSGSGKSTLLRCVNRLLEPTSGSVAINGQPILDLSHEDVLELRKQNIAMVFQNFGLLPHRSVAENAGFGLELRGMQPKERRQRAMEALETVGLTDVAEQPVQALSGGMQQRVGLARALATRADILLMDEAFSALDPLIRTNMQAEFLQLQESYPKTILFITHDLSEALTLGDRIAIMKDGAIVQIGGPEEIITEPADDYVRSFVENVDRSRVVTVSTAMDSEKAPPTLPPDATAAEAVEKMEQSDLPYLYVVKEGKLRGVVRLRDAQEHEGKVEDIMLSSRTAGVDQHLIAILQRSTQDPWPLPVVDGQGRLQGVIFRDELLKAIAGGAAS
ncbi:quaternary amine ABC transporter ATP-binding protein [Desulfohalovibrio reitneri]|uniref:quaternary amine ABC transporter ATP-binding protein n=1 Tax=Desulfohalovibrio reitneri TaxID=1307759 RepID=UPI0004A76F34|nr:glycine betaine/L-proline ABC transporter ATP-binding protein [Desulfohalovibrio reitneri]